MLRWEGKGKERVGGKMGKEGKGEGKTHHRASSAEILQADWMAGQGGNTPDG